MIPDTGDKYKGKIVTYLFRGNEKMFKTIDYIKTKYNREVVNLHNGEIPVPEFLAAIKDAEYLVTNSFHGMCFALIFNKKVICGGGDALSAVKKFNHENDYTYLSTGGGATLDYIINEKMAIID